MELRRLTAPDTEQTYALRLRALEHAPDAFFTTLQENDSLVDEQHMILDFG